MPFTRVSVPTSPCSPRKAKPPMNPLPGRERQRVAVQHPRDRDGDDGDPRHHHHVQDALRPGHSSVEEGQAGGHQQDKRGTREHPRGRTSINLHTGLLACLPHRLGSADFVECADVFRFCEKGIFMFHPCFTARRGREPVPFCRVGNCDRVGDACLRGMGGSPIVIVGGGFAGGNAAATLREEGFTGPVVIVGPEPGVPFGRPSLSKTYLRSEEDLEGGTSGQPTGTPTTV